MDQKVSATRIFGYLALLGGVFYAALTVMGLASLRFFRLWNLGVPVLLQLLSLLVAANLIYIGWHTVARGTVPVKPRVFFHWRDLLRMRATVNRSMSLTVTRIVVGIVFFLCGYAGARMLSAYEASIPPWQNLSWPLLIMAVEFPVSMLFALILAMALGWIRTRPARYVLGAVGLLVLANVIGAIIFYRSLLVYWLTLWVMGGLFIALIVSAFLVAVAKEVLRGESPEAEKQVVRFWLTLVTVGIPLGVVLGMASFFKGDTSNLWIPQVQTVWGTMMGIWLARAQTQSLRGS
jgi:hypothetical protein